MNPPNPSPYKKATSLFGAILLTASVSGFFMGLRQTSSQISMTRAVSLVAFYSEGQALLETNNVPTSVPYWKQDWLKEGPNAGWENSVAHLVRPPAEQITLTNITAVDRAAALTERAARRAFDGAPPVVPHTIAQDSPRTPLGSNLDI